MPNQPHNPNPLNPPTEHMRRYWEALGRFVHEFAQVEKMLFVTIRHLANVSIPIGRAVFSGVRSNVATGLITRALIAIEADEPTRKDFETIFAQLGHITDARNLILHHGTVFNEGAEFEASNSLVALDRSRARKVPVSTEILEAMTADLEKIGDHLMFHEGRDWMPADSLERITGERRRAAWRYKPPSQAPRGGKPQNTTPERKPPP